MVSSLLLTVFPLHFVICLGALEFNLTNVGPTQYALLSYDGHPVLALVDTLDVLQVRAKVPVTADAYDELMVAVMGIMDVVTIIGPVLLAELLPVHAPHLEVVATIGLCMITDYLHSLGSGSPGPYR